MCKSSFLVYLPLSFSLSLVVTMEHITEFHPNLYLLVFGKILGPCSSDPGMKLKTSAQWGPNQSFEFRVELHWGK